MSASVTSRHSTSAHLGRAGECQRHDAARRFGGRLETSRRSANAWRQCLSRRLGCARPDAGERQHRTRTEERHALSRALPLEAIDLQPERAGVGVKLDVLRFHKASCTAAATMASPSASSARSFRALKSDPHSGHRDSLLAVPGDPAHDRAFTKPEMPARSSDARSRQLRLNRPHA